MSWLDFRDFRQIVWFAAGSVLQAGLGLTGFSTGEVRFRRSEMCVMSSVSGEGTGRRGQIAFLPFVGPKCGFGGSKIMLSSGVYVC